MLSFFMMTAVALAGQDTNVLELRIRTLMHKVRTSPKATLMGADWYRIVEKENLSKHAVFDYRFDMRMIDVQGTSLGIGHREEQNSSSTPNSNWVIEYNFIDRLGDGILDYYDKDRFISIELSKGTWYRTIPYWPDRHIYGDALTEEQALKLFKQELTYWENILK